MVLELRKQARQLENEIDLKLVSFSKLGTNYRGVRDYGAYNAVAHRAPFRSAGPVIVIVTATGSMCCTIRILLMWSTPDYQPDGNGVSLKMLIEELSFKRCFNCF